MARRANRKRKNQAEKQGTLPVLKPHAAGIDIGAMEIYVAIPPDRDPEPVRQFSHFTGDLIRMAEWLRACRIETVAMEATGVYWIPVYQILEEHEIEVCLVNARYFQNVPGRRTDVGDCQWLQQLHAVGLLRGSFRPKQEICAVRSLWRHRENLVQMAAQHVQHMQKALDQMNVQLHHVISDLTGVTGLRIVEAILQGERNPVKLAALRDGRIQASEETICKALVGDYREEHLVTLRQSLEFYRFYQDKIEQLDVAIQRQISALDSKVDVTQTPLPPNPAKQTRRQHNEPGFSLRNELYRVSGVDLTAVPGISVMVAQTLLTEIGPDLSRFPNASAFASYLALCPDREITGGKVTSSRTRKTKSRAALALRLGAQALHHSNTYLGDFFRRMRAKLGTPQAITATAHKLARIVYHMLRTGEAYDETLFAKKEQEHRARTEKKLKLQAKALGYQLVPLTA